MDWHPPDVGQDWPNARTFRDFLRGLRLLRIRGRDEDARAQFDGYLAAERRAPQAEKVMGGDDWKAAYSFRDEMGWK